MWTVEQRLAHKENEQKSKKIKLPHQEKSLLKFQEDLQTLKRTSERALNESKEEVNTYRNKLTESQEQLKQHRQLMQQAQQEAEDHRQKKLWL